MAIICKITDGATEIDFVSASGLRCKDDYAPKICIPSGDGAIPPYEIEVLPCFIYEVTDNNLAAELQRFHLLQKRAAEFWHDQNKTSPVWFYMKLNNESNQRRALVKSLGINPQANWFQCATGINSFWDGVVVSIERHPAWEPVSPLTMNPATNLSGASIVHDYTAGAAADIVGDISARIQLKLTDGRRWWLGFRSAIEHGTLANFVPVWECEDGNNGTDAADNADATASGGVRVQVVPNVVDWDASYNEALEIYLSQVTANYQDNFGEFVWLLRARVTAGEWSVYLGSAQSSLAPSNVEPVFLFPVGISSTDWNFYNLGQARIPHRNLQAVSINDAAATYDADFRVEIWAKRESGAGSLYLDCLCPIPIDEGFCFIDAREQDRVWYYQSPHDVDTAIVEYTVTGLWQGVWPAASVNFRAPVGDGRLVMAFAQAIDSDITDVIDFSGQYFPRWLSLRGSE